MSSNASQIILGIDPGLEHTGWGIIQQTGNHLSHIANGTIHTNTKMELSGRLQALYSGLHDVLNTHTIDSAGIEETFVNKNAGSSLKLGHARGVLMMTVSLAEIPLSEYAATKVKKSVCGVGRAEKQQVQAMLKILLPGAPIDSADSADALAVAICHAHHINQPVNLIAG